ncbi:glycosyltransferase family 2 protein [Candidatus Woesearchaeota archaeon]|nr:glycosyltransferase family 2 protein [Candidatus Woesearchaeota archaeon]
MEISIIIPAFNEEKRIKKTIEAILAYLERKKYSYEIIVVNDGSTDKTKDAALEFSNRKISVLDNPGNCGKGYSVKQGFLAATKKWILFTDADLSTPIEELETCFRYTDIASVIIGSRNLPMSHIAVKQPFLRSTFGKIFPFFVRLLLLPDIRDSQCGFKLFRHDAAKKIAEKQRIPGFCFDVELLFLARKYGFIIQEIPVSWSNDERSKIRIFSDSFHMFFDLLKIRWNSFYGRYA